MLADAEYNAMLDRLMLAVEDALEEQAPDLDCEPGPGMLTLKCPGGHIVISRQPPLQQLWLAAKSGGHHFAWQGGQWICTRSGREFYQMLGEALEQQAGIRARLP